MSTNPVLIIPIHKKKADGTFYSTREWLWLNAGKRCHWCQCVTRLGKNQEWDSTTIDHVIPRYKGGGNEASNLVAACQRCNNRRSHEDARGLAEGHLLGKWKVGAPNPLVSNVGGQNRVALTKDDKKVLMAKMSVGGVSTTQVHVQQRDQALKEIAKLREDKGKLESDAHLYRIELSHKDQEIARLTARLETMTIRDLLRSRVARWLLR